MNIIVLMPYQPDLVQCVSSGRSISNFDSKIIYHVEKKENVNKYINKSINQTLSILLQFNKQDAR